MKRFIRFSLIAVFLISGCQKMTPPVLDQVHITANSPDSVAFSCPVSGTRIDHCGFCLGKTASNLVVEKAKWVVDGEFSNGIISGIITGLTPNTIYFVSAYAENKEGIAYSAPLKFTSAPRVPNPDDNSYPTF